MPTERTGSAPKLFAGAPDEMKVSAIAGRVTANLSFSWTSSRGCCRVVAFSLLSSETAVPGAELAAETLSPWFTEGVVTHT